MNPTEQQIYEIIGRLYVANQLLLAQISERVTVTDTEATGNTGDGD